MALGSTWTLRAIGLLALVGLSAAPTSTGANELAFGPVTCQRGTGAPTICEYSFTATEPSRGHVLKVDNGGLEDTAYEMVSASTITLNGTEILNSSRFSQNVSYLEVPVSLQSQNAFSVEVRGKPGGALVLKIHPLVGIDAPVEGQILKTAQTTVSGHLSAAVTAVTVNGLSAIVSGGSFSITAVPLDEGPNTLVVTAVRDGGFTGEDSVRVTVDSTPPTVTIDHPPEGFVSANAVLPAFTVVDALDPSPAVSLAPSPPFVAEGAHQFSVTATDWAGNSATAGRTFIIDTTPPAISSFAPAANSATADASTAVSASYSDALGGIGPGAVRLLVDGVDVTPSATVLDTGVTWQSLAPLADGLHQVALFVRDRAGNEAAAQWTFTTDTTPPAISVTSPAEGSTVAASAVNVGGSVDDPAATVRVNGTVVALAGGSFTAPGIQLAPGPNIITVTAVDAAGNVSSIERHVTSASSPPTLSFSSNLTSIMPGQPATLSWTSSGATSCSLSPGARGLGTPGIPYLPPVGTLAIGPWQTTTYTMRATGPGGSVEAQVTVTMITGRPTVTLSASPVGLVYGQSSLLSWTSTGATLVQLSPAIGLVGSQGSLAVTPQVTTTYSILAANSFGLAFSQVTVTVSSHPPPSVTLSAFPTTLLYGQPCTLSWSSTVATAVNIAPDIGAVGPSGSLSVTPLQTTTYTITASGPGGTAAGQANVTVIPPPSITFSANPTTIGQGQTATLAWAASDATEVTIAPSVGPTDVNGSANVAPMSTTTYTATATGPAGTAVAQATVTVVPPPTLSAHAVPGVIALGETSTVSWNATDATSVSIAPGIGSVPPSGEMMVSPKESTTYSFACSGPAGTATTEVTVVVLQPPTVLLSASPATVVRGESTTLSWSTTGATSIAIDQGIGAVGGAGTLALTPASTTTYRITAAGPGGVATAATTVTVHPPGIEAGISASPTTIAPGGSTTLTWSSYAADRVVIEPGVGTVSPSGSRAVSPAASTTYRLMAVGPTGVALSSVRVSVQGSPAPIPEGQFGAKYQDLVPADATIVAYDAKRFSLVTGTVLGREGLPLANVRISVLQRAELGTATTGEDGAYTLPVEGGGTMVLSLEREGFLAAQRQVSVGWNDIAAVETVVMLAEESVATTITPDGNPASVFIHRGSVTTDEFGSRAATLAVAGDTRVYAVTETGDMELRSFELRATEYARPGMMPAALPPESIYTYCVNVRASGLERVRFSKPATLFVENFLGVPVGTIVPVGYYDFKLARWVASENGTVVTLLDADGDGVTDAVDATGDGLADDLNGDGISSDEAGGLTDAAHYPPGSTFWRAAITHLTPYDLNFPWVWVFPATADPPNGSGPPGGDLPREVGDAGAGDGGSCGGSSAPISWLNSYADSQGRIFHDDLAIPGADFRLHYASDRVPGYRAVITVPASGDTVPASLNEIEVRVTVAGRVLEQRLPPEPNQIVSFTWDGLDHLGREVTSPATARVEVGFVYLAYIAGPGSQPLAFGRAGGTPLFSPARMTGTLWKTTTIDVHRNVPVSNMGQGWDLSIHHTMSPANPTVLFKGDGSILRQDLRPLRRHAGGSPNIWTDFHCGPAGLAVDAAGNLFVSDTCVHRVLKIDRTGRASTYAGQWEDRSYGGGFSGDGGPATSARLKNPTALAVDPAGTLYIFDSGNLRIRKVDTSGTITTAVGNGQSGSSPDGTAAAVASMPALSWANGMTTDMLGNLYYIDRFRGVRRIGADGLLTTVLSSSDAYDALAVDRAGNLYAGLRRASGGAVVQRLSPDGRVVTVAGGGSKSDGRDGSRALDAFFSGVSGLAVDPDGILYLITSGASDQEIYRIDPAGILRSVPHPSQSRALAFDAERSVYALSTVTGYVYKLAVPANSQAFGETGDFLFTEGGLGYLFSAAGRHKATIDLASQISLFVFGYDGNRLVSVTDRFGRATTIERDGAGHPTVIVLPDGRQTRVFASEGHLERLAYPDNSDYVLGYDSGGLLREKWDPNGNHFTYDYDASGRLARAQDPEGGEAAWLRWQDSSGKTYTRITRAEGTGRTFQETNDWDGSYASVMTGADGSVRMFSRSADRSTETIASGCGMERTGSYSLDPLWDYKYLRGMTDKTPSGLTRTRTFSPTYQDTDGDLKFDRIARSVTVNGRTATLIENTLTGTQTSTSPAGRVSTTTYDPGTLLPLQVSAAGFLPVSFRYDDRGNLVESSAGTRATRIVYDEKDMLDYVTTPDGQTYDYSFDDVGLLQAVVRPDGSRTEYRYDANGNLTAVTNPNLVSYGFDYTANNQRKNFVQPLSGSSTYWYDRERRLERVVAPSGAEIVNRYAAGNLATTTTPEGTTAYEFLCGGRVSGVARNGEGNSFGYDGPLVVSDTRTGTLSQTIGYAYDNDFALTSMTYAGAALGLGYDSDGLLTRCGEFTIFRDVQNGLPLKLSGQGLVTARTFSGFGELDGSESTVGGASVYSWSVASRDAAGRIRQRTETIAGSAIDWEYAYDLLGRLLEVKKDGLVVESYSFDANGNRLSQTSGPPGVASRWYEYSSEDHVVVAGSDSYQYDIDGFLEATTTVEGTTSYEYSSRGELLRVDKPDGAILTYQHDPFGRRITKQLNGATIETYLWRDQVTLLAVYDGGGALLQRYTYADGRAPVSMTAGGTTYFLLTDQVGSLRAVADTAGNIVKRIDYDSFGNILADSNPSFTVPFGFAGGLHDRDTGLVRFGYRDYSPELGRFTAKDPIDFAGGDANLYAYVMSDPVNFVDPSGLYGYGPHLYAPIQAATEAGMPMQIARLVGLASQSVDMMHDPFDPANRKYHFSTTEQARARVKSACTISELGEAIHTLMDSYSHEGLSYSTSLQVHVWQSLLPDAWDPNSERDQLMYSSVRAAISSWMKDHPGYSR